MSHTHGKRHYPRKGFARPRDIQHRSRRVVRQARDGTWYWKLIAANNRTSCSGHGYNSYRTAFQGALAAREIMADSVIIDSHPSALAKAWERI